MKRSFLIILLVIFSIVLIGTTILYKKESSDSNNKKHYFTEFKLINEKKDFTFAEQKDEITYSDFVIRENVLTAEYKYLQGEDSIKGDLYIGEDNYMYITDNINERNYRISSVKFKTMFVNEWYMFVYAISEDNDVYFINLQGNDISKIEVRKIEINFDAINFVDINYKSDMYKSPYAIFVLSDDGNIYEVTSGIRYRESILSLYGNLLVFDDKTITNVDGRLLEDKNGNSYKIKYIFFTYDGNKEIGKQRVLIVTEDNKFLYMNDDFTSVYEFDRKVSNLKYDSKYPYMYDKLEITFDDNYVMEVSAACNEYYCINELED